MGGRQKSAQRRLWVLPFNHFLLQKFGVLLLYAKLHPCEIPRLILFCLFVFHFTETQSNLIPLESKEMTTQKRKKNEKMKKENVAPESEIFCGRKRFTQRSFDTLSP